MKSRQFSEEEMVTILTQADCREEMLGEICRAHGVSVTRFHD
jgi:hypothetical protein